MPWKKVHDCPYYPGVQWVHPLKQKSIFRIREHVREKCPGVTHIVLFGSSVTDRCHFGSDLDLYIFGDPEGNFYPPVDLDEEYDIMWDKFMERSGPLWERIKEEGVVVYGEIST